MTSYGPPQALYYIVDALLCITYLIGMVAGVIALTRKKTVPGILALVAFLFFGLELLTRLLIWNVLYNVVYDYAALNWASFCISTPLLLLGGVAMAVAIFMLAGKKNVLPPPPGIDEDPPAN
jgi:hypothetical protein